MTENVLSVDIGTTSLKAGLFTAEGEVVSFCSIPYSAPENRYVAEGWIWALKGALSKLSTESKMDAASIKAIVISGNGPTLVADSGLTLRWNENVLPYDGESLFMPRIIAFKDLFPYDFDDTMKLFSGPEYLICKLTNHALTILPEDRYISAYWTSDELEGNKIPVEKMPAFVKTGSYCGGITEEAAEFLELKADTPVFAGGPDFIVALVGTDTLEEGKLCDRCGSSEGLNLCVSKKIVADGIRTLPSVVPGLWNISVLIPNSAKLSEDDRLEKIAEGLSLLKKVAEENGQKFPSEMTVTGGQSEDAEYLKKKSEKLGMKLITLSCPHAELLGDAKIGWDGLKKA